MTVVTAYEPTAGLWREMRLEKMLAAMRSFLAHAAGEAPNLNELLISVHDNRGAVEAVWKDEKAKEQLSSLLDLAWIFQGEPAENNTHSVMT